MYNRYILQPDGTYRRNRVPETTRPGPLPRPPEPPKPFPLKPNPAAEPPSAPPPPPGPCGPDKPQSPPPPGPCGPNKPQSPPPPGPNGPACPQPRQGGVGGFLRQLLPKDFDTGDLFIILLLLLMAGECEDGQNTAFLTLILYLCM